MTYTTYVITTDEAEVVPNARPCDPFINGSKESTQLGQDVGLLLLGRHCHDDGGLDWLLALSMEAFWFMCDARCQCCTMSMK